MSTNISNILSATYLVALSGSNISVMCTQQPTPRTWFLQHHLHFLDLQKCHRLLPQNLHCQDLHRG